MTTVVKGAQSCCSVGSSLLRSSVSDHALLINEAKSKEWEQDDLFGNLKGRCYL